MNCQQCGNENSDRSKFCIFCGSSLSNQESKNTGIPFKPKPLKQQSFIQRLFNRQPIENVIIAINNLLAQDVRLTGIENVERVFTDYKISPRNQNVRRGLRDLYQQYLGYCLSDRKLSDSEINELIHLKNIFGLTDHEVDDMHNKAVGEVYGASINEAIADGRLDESEREFLGELRRNLRLPDDAAKQIYATRAKAYLDSYLSSVVADKMLSPDEEQEMQAIAKSLGIEIVFEDRTAANLDKYRLFWQIENGQLPEMKVGINLQRSEKCYCFRDVDWYEHRRVTKRVQYSGPTARIKIVSGVYWRMGDIAVKRISEDILTHIDSGRVFVTNKRLIFMGSQKNTSIRLSKILDMAPPQKGGTSILLMTPAH